MVGHQLRIGLDSLQQLLMILIWMLIFLDLEHYLLLELSLIWIAFGMQHVIYHGPFYIILMVLVIQKGFLWVLLV